MKKVISVLSPRGRKKDETAASEQPAQEEPKTPKEKKPSVLNRILSAGSLKKNKGTTNAGETETVPPPPPEDAPTSDNQPAESEAVDEPAPAPSEASSSSSVPNTEKEDPAPAPTPAANPAPPQIEQTPAAPAPTPAAQVPTPVEAPVPAPATATPAAPEPTPVAATPAVHEPTVEESGPVAHEPTPAPVEEPTPAVHEPTPTPAEEPTPVVHEPIPAAVEEPAHQEPVAAEPTQPEKVEETPAAVEAPTPAPEPATEAHVEAPQATKQPKIAIVYYSTYGHILKLAEAVREGVLATGAACDILQVHETLPAEVLEKMHAPPKADYPFVDVSTLSSYDGFLFGFPTRFGMMAAQFKAFIDSTGSLWQAGALVGKPAGIFTSTAVLQGGQETTTWTALTILSHHGMLFVPTGFSFGGPMFDISQVRGGSAYGASTFAGPDGSRQPTEVELQIATHQGKYFAGVVRKLA